MRLLVLFSLWCCGPAWAGEPPPSHWELGLIAAPAPSGLRIDRGG